MDKREKLSLALDIIERAKSLISSGWTQDCFARDKDGQSIDYTNSDAVCFCAEGALHRASHDMKIECLNVLTLVFANITKSLPYGHDIIYKYNDIKLTKAGDIYRLFDQAQMRIQKELENDQS